MEVSQHDVRLPEANELDDVVIDLCAHERHGTASMKWLDWHIIFAEANIRANEADRLMQQWCDVLDFEGSFAVVVIVGGDWDDGRCGVLANVDDAAYEGASRAAMSGATACMIDDFTMDTLFMCGKDEGGQCGCKYFCIWCREMVDESIANPELNIIHAKGSIICLGALVFPRSKEIKESKTNSACCASSCWFGCRSTQEKNYERQVSSCIIAASHDMRVIQACVDLVSCHVFTCR
jgi:hypothetical protein